MGEGSHPVVSQQVLDPDSLAQAIRDADFVPCQLSAKPSKSVLSRVVFPQVCLDIAALGPAMLFSGSMPRGCYTLVFVTKCPQKGRSFNFAVEHNEGYMGFFPPGGLVDAYTPEGYTNATLTVPAAVFRAAVERLFPEIPEDVLKHGAGLRIGVEDQVRLRKLLGEVMAEVENPASILFCESVHRHMECELLDTYLMALAAGSGSPVPKPGLRMEGRLRRLRQARDYLAENYHSPASLAELCNELRMSKRGVEMLFQDSMGIGPNAFIRHQRLHGVRRALKAAPRVVGVVKQTALAWGFWHMGHFAREYRELFGESPSATLSR